MSALFAKTLTVFREIQYYLEIITFGSSLYIMDHWALTVTNFMGNNIGLQRIKTDYNLLS